MKTSYVVIFLLLSHFSFCQIRENFDDGNIAFSPNWQGDTSFFMVNGVGQLQSKGPNASSQLALSTPNTQIFNTEWSFYVKLAFSPSSGNYAKIYLASDQSDLKSPLNGYYLRIGGETGNTDGIDLYKQQGTTNTKLIDGIAGHAGKSVNSLRIKVIRDTKGNWSLLCDTIGGYNYVREGSVFDTTFSTTSYFGITYIHSATRKDLFFFDNLEIKEAPLSIENAKAINDTCIEISFNKNLDKTSAENPSNYLINNSEYPSVAILNFETTTVRLYTHHPLSTGNYSITVANAKDTSGNSIGTNNTISFNYTKPLFYGDIIITEIYPDPSPSMGLPDAEYLEIYNNTLDTIDINGYSLSDGTTISTISSYKLMPFQYHVLTHTSVVNEFQNHGLTVGISPWPSLNNATDQISLRDENGNLIFNISYSEEWYDEEEKSEGGWSLEMINPNEHCASRSNWKASANSQGGTPGKINSIYSNIPDLTAPELTELIVEDSMHLILKFNETIDTIIQVSDFHIDQNIFAIIAHVIDPQTISLTLNPPLEIKHTYQLDLLNIKDCKGNKITHNISNSLVLPEISDSLDIVINEILFNPFTNGVDFVEIYNRSDKFIDLKNWRLGNIKTDFSSDLQKIVTSSYILGPNQYGCITTDPSIVASQYLVLYPERIITIPDLPSYNDDFGSVLLINADGKTMDQFNYHEQLHFSMIDEEEGISLERISFYAPTNNPHNWHSAAETAGWATPGYENSQHKEIEFSKIVSIDPKVFTPDQDSWKDFTFINYKFNEPGFMANITVFDIKGRVVKTLAKNEMLGIEGSFQWDGTLENGQKANIGYYIVYFEAFNLKGEVSKYKETVVLAGKL